MTDELVLALTYHSVSAGDGPLRASPAQLGDQLDWMLRCGLRPATLRSIVDRLERNGGFEAPCFAVTFDDAYRDFVDAALPVLEARGIPATLFATASSDRRRLPEGLDRPLLGLEELAGLSGRGVDVGAHSIAHLDL
ncbi:MAG: polysaccharide deacetylase family protein, partial [Candidatus Binatia bacterium]